MRSRMHFCTGFVTMLLTVGCYGSHEDSPGWERKMDDPELDVPPPDFKQAPPDLDPPVDGPFGDPFSGPFGDRGFRECIPGETSAPALADAWWSDPTVAVSAAGWRDSVEVLCARNFGIEQLWADDSGVYVSVYEFVADTCDARGVYINRGQGWTKFDAPPLEVPGRLDRMPNGNLMSWGAHDCGVQELVDGEWRCRLEQPVKSLHSGDGVAHAIAGRGWDNMLLYRFDDGDWEPQAPPPRAGTDIPALGIVWGSAQRVFVSGTHVGTMFVFEDGQWSLTRTGSAQVFSSIWGNSADDIWAGTHDDPVFLEPDIFHYDGQEWSGQPWGATIECGGEYPTISGMWGSGDTLYVHSTSELVRLRNGTFESLLRWECDDGFAPEIRGIWGMGADELFVVLSDYREPTGPQPCGETVLLYFDGTEFHQF